MLVLCKYGPGAQGPGTIWARGRREIYVLNNCTQKEQNWLINSVKKHNKNKARVKEVIAFVKEKGGLAYAVSKMEQFQLEALELLKKYPNSEYKEALVLMVNYVISRDK